MPSHRIIDVYYTLTVRDGIAYLDKIIPILPLLCIARVQTTYNNRPFRLLSFISTGADQSHPSCLHHSNPGLEKKNMPNVIDNILTSCDTYILLYTGYSRRSGRPLGLLVPPTAYPRENQSEMLVARRITVNWRSTDDDQNDYCGVKLESPHSRSNHIDNASHIVGLHTESA